MTTTTLQPPDPLTAAPVPGPDAVRRAATALAGRVVRTPVLSVPELDAVAGAHLHLKAENLQRGGSYKLRGATTALLAHVAARPGVPVVAQSTGNHAVAVALAARDLGVGATVVLPPDAPAAKVAAARGAGARVLLAGPGLAERRALVERECRRTGARAVDAYDDADVVAGQGTATLELLEQTAAAGVRLDTVVVPVGGGGGIAGACLAARAAGRPDLAVVGVEPVGNDSLRRSLAAGRPVDAPGAATLADGLRPARVGALPYAVATGATPVAEVLTVDDAEIATALHRLLLLGRLLVEPSAAAALAGAVRHGRAHPGTHVGVLLTGGTLDEHVLLGVLAGGAGASR